MWVMWCNSYRAILRNEKYWMSEYMFWYLWIITLLIIPSLLFFFCAKKERTKNFELAVYLNKVLLRPKKKTKYFHLIQFNSIQFIYFVWLNFFLFDWNFWAALIYVEIYYLSINNNMCSYLGWHDMTSIIKLIYLVPAITLDRDGHNDVKRQ